MNALLPFGHDIDAVRRAGEVIGGDLLWTSETEPRIREAFSVANHWRDSHAYPMRSIHQTLQAHIRLQELEGFTAARLKRMNAIRGKLRRMGGRKRPLGLETFQDLGGCRAIMSSMQNAEALIGALKDRCRHALWDQNDYIHEARQSGYRSHHLKFEFRGKGMPKARGRTDIKFLYAANMGPELVLDRRRRPRSSPPSIATHSDA